MFLVPEVYDIIEIDKLGVISQYRKQKVEIFKELPHLEDYEVKIIDEKLNFKISSFIGKVGIILCKFDFVRCILTRDKCRIFQSNNLSDQLRLKELVSSIQTSFRENQEKALLLHVLKNILKYLSNYYASVVAAVRPNVTKISNDTFSDNISPNIKAQIVAIQTQLLSLDFKISNIKELLDELYEEEKEYLESLCFTVDPVERDSQANELGDIIDTYRKYFEETVDEISQMDSMISLSLKIVTINISETRNSLAEFSIYLSIVGLSVNLANLVSSTFGMNLLSHMEESNYAFYLILGFMLILMVISCGTGYCLHRWYKK